MVLRLSVGIMTVLMPVSHLGGGRGIAGDDDRLMLLIFVLQFCFH